MEATVSFFPTFPDSLKPTRGSMIVRVWTTAASGPVPRRRQVEHLAALQEERPLFREVEVVAQVDVDLAGVGLDLAEVGVVRSRRG